MRRICDSIASCKEEKTILFVKNGYPIKECKTCGHRFIEIKDANTHLTEVYSDDYFYGGKQGYPNYLESQELLLKAGVRYAKIVGKYRSKGEMLDVGSAAGFILKGFESEGWLCHGIEPNDTMASYGREILKLDIQTGTLESYSTARKFDLVTLIQVVGHFHDLDKALQNVADLLTPDGLALVESWDMKSAVAKLMGRNWQEYSPPSVVHWFSGKTIKQSFEHYGLKLIGSGRPVKKIRMVHALSLLDEKMPNFIYKKSLLGILKKALGGVNVTYPPIDLKWFLFKKV